MSDESLLDHVISDMPSWFQRIFKCHDRLCLPYVLSVKDVDDILKTVDCAVIRFHLSSCEVSEIRVVTIEEFLNAISYCVFQQAPLNAVVEFPGQDSWIYYDGDQRFSILVANKSKIKGAFRNSREIMKLYYIDETDDISLDLEMKERLFHCISSIM